MRLIHSVYLYLWCEGLRVLVPDSHCRIWDWH